MATKHGTRSHYVLEKCRCSRCIKANKTYLREYRERKNGKVKRAR